MSGVFRLVPCTARLWVTFPPLCTLRVPPRSALIIDGEIWNSLRVTSVPADADTLLLASLLFDSAFPAIASAENASTTVMRVNTIVAAPKPRSSGFLRRTRTTASRKERIGLEGHHRRPRPLRSRDLGPENAGRPSSRRAPAPPVSRRASARPLRYSS